MMSEINSTVRSLLKHRVFMVTAVLTLAIGIGATAATFAVVDGVLIKALPYPVPGCLVSISHLAPGLDVGGPVDLSGAQWFTYREANRTFEQLGLWSAERGTVTGLGRAEEVRRLTVSYGTLQALQVPPAIGRWFSESDDAPAAPRTILLTYDYWQRKFGADPSVIGKPITVDGQPREVIGVMPRTFRFLNVGVDVILPMRLERAAQKLGIFNYRAIARLRPTATLEQASTDVERMDRIWITAWPSPFAGNDMQNLLAKARLTPSLSPLKQSVVGHVERVLWLVMGTIAIVFLIACANVANLMLVRAEVRQQEFAVKAALGAGRFRIARGLLLEGFMLALPGSIFGLALALGAVRMLVAMAPSSLPRLDQIAIDGRVAVLVAALAMLAGAVSSLVPILHQRRSVSSAWLQRSSRTSSASPHQHRTRQALVIAEVALCLVLLVTAGLMVRTVLALRAVDVGFENPAAVQLVSVSIPSAVAGDPVAVIAKQQEILTRLAAIPGISAASYGNSAPLDIDASSHGVLMADGVAYGPDHPPPVRAQKYVAPGFFEVTGVPLLAGRDLTWNDIALHRSFVLISEGLAREEWRQPANAIGKRVREQADGPWREVIGVVGDVRDEGLDVKAPATVYYPVLTANLWGEALSVRRGVTFAVRTTRAGTGTLAAEIRDAISTVIPDVPITRMRTLLDLRDQALAPAAFTLLMLAVAATMALLLGIVGIYGVISYTVAQRTREIGIRVALGAEQPQLRRMFVAHGLALAMIGVGVGMAGSLLVTRLMSALLFGVTATDPATFAATATVLVAVALLASYLPARRASRIEPMMALRSE
jgi:putative ABC transport system permease protein